MVDLLPSSERILRTLALTPEDRLVQISFKELAEKTGLGLNTVSRNIKRLEIRGYIKTFYTQGKAMRIVVHPVAYQVLAHDTPSLS